MFWEKKKTPEEVEKELNKNVQDIFAKYAPLLKSGEEEKSVEEIRSRFYNIFVQEEVRKTIPTTVYEKLCKLLGIIQIELPASIEKKYADAIEINDWAIKPSEVIASGFVLVLSFLALLISGILLGVGDFNIFLFSTIVLMGIGYFFWYPILKSKKIIQEFVAESPLGTLYIIIYMRNVPNLENAIRFAASELTGPFGKDLRRMLWNIETGEFRTVEEGLEFYMKKWKTWDEDIVNSIRLIRNTLYEQSNIVREDLFRKAISVVLEGTTTKMNAYADSLKTPIEAIHMLGIMLPVMVMMTFPLIAMFMADRIKPEHLFLGYNVLLPIILLLIISVTLEKRPGDFIKPDLTSYKNLLPIGKFKFREFIVPVWPFAIALFLVIGMPGIIHVCSNYTSLGVETTTVGEGDIEVNLNKNSYFTKEEMWVDYKPGDAIISGELYDKDGKIVGNFKKGDASNRLVLRISSLNLKEGRYEAKFFAKDSSGEKIILKRFNINEFSFLGIIYTLTLIIAAAVSLAFYFYYSYRSRKNIRREILDIEEDFGNSLFETGNIVLAGNSIENSFQKAAALIGKSPSLGFFELVSQNIVRLGVSLKEAVFNPEFGALTLYPSRLIRSIFIVILDSSKKGIKSAGNTMITISNYIKDIFKIERTIKEMMYDTVSSMNFQAVILSPFISAIVVALVFLIMQIFLYLSAVTNSMESFLSSSSSLGSEFGTSSLPSLLGGGGFLNMSQAMPPGIFQLVVGLYMIETVLIISYFVNQITEGGDPVSHGLTTSKILILSVTIYSIILVITTLMFAGISDLITSGLVPS